jgi:hypothetical protein
LRERIRIKLPRTREDSLAKVIEDLNPMLRGWFNYFKHAHMVAQLGIDGFTVAGYARFCVSRRSDRELGNISMIIVGGSMLSLQPMGCSPYRRPMG